MNEQHDSGVLAVAAWAHEDDPARVISAVQKVEAERDGGASASSLRPYSVALVRAASGVRVDAEKLALQQAFEREADDADALLTMLLPGIEPSDLRTDGGAINVPKVRTLLAERAAGVRAEGVTSNGE